MSHTAIVQKLVDYLQENPEVNDQFRQSFDTALSTGIEEFSEYGIQTFDDYISYMDKCVNWIPTENVTGRNVIQHICVFYFIIDQHPVNAQQSPIHPSTTKPYTWLSQWLIEYAQVMGSWMDSPDSITDATIDTFYDAPAYHMDDYPRPEGGWKCYNDFFARHINPAVRPIAPDTDESVVIVNAADCTFDGVWPINEETADITTFDAKGIPWSIAQLLDDTEYGPRFAGGIFTHSFLQPHDYHRQHAPVSGTVIEARVIPGLCYLEVVLETTSKGKNCVKMHRPMRRPLNPYTGKSDVSPPDNPGYQFIQARALILIDNPDLGLVAVLPIGMAQVSSVPLSVRPGQVVEKGEEISYFQFGGSDIIMVFEKAANVTFNQTEGKHYNYGDAVATAPKKNQ